VLLSDKKGPTISRKGHNVIIKGRELCWITILLNSTTYKILGVPINKKNETRTFRSDLWYKLVQNLNTGQQKRAGFKRLSVKVLYYMARACKYTMRAVIGQYSGSDFPVMPASIMKDVNARRVKRRKRCGKV